MAMMASGTSGDPNIYDDHALLDEDFLNDGMKVSTANLCSYVDIVSRYRTR